MITTNFYSNRNFATLVLILAFLLLSGCSSGVMRINETYYLGASNGEDHVYYRIRVHGSTVLGKSDFKQGWYQAGAVDALFGDVSAKDPADALTVQEELRKQTDMALMQAHKDYVEIVSPAL